MSQRLLSCASIPLVALIAIGMPAVFGQETSESDTPAPTASGPETQPTTTPASQPAAVPTAGAADLTPDVVNANIKQISASTNLPEAVKQQVLDLYGQALTQLEAATSWTQRAEAYVAGRDQAPVELEAVRQRLSQTTQPVGPAAVDVPADATLEQLTQRLTEAEAELRTRQDAANRLEDEVRNRAARRTAIPELLIDANKRLESINAELSAPPASGTPPELAQARRTLRLAQRKAIDQEIRAQEEELRAYTVGADLLEALRTEAKLAVARAEERVKAWQKIVSDRRQFEATAQQRAAESAVREVPPAVQAIAQQNAKLAQERAELAQRIDQVTQHTRTAQETYQRLDADLTDLREKLTSLETTTYLGPLLLRKRAELPDERDHEKAIRTVKDQLDRANVRYAEIDDQQRTLLDVQTRIDEVMRDLRREATIEDPARIEEEVRKLLLARQETLAGLKKDAGEYWNDLIDLHRFEVQLHGKITEFASLINENVLWIRNTGPLHRAALPNDLKARDRRWLGTLAIAWGDLRDHPIIHVFAACLFAMWLASLRAIRVRLTAISERASKLYTDAYTLTLRALAATVWIAIGGPFVLSFVGWRLAAAESTVASDAAELAQALGGGMQVGGLAWLGLALLRVICRPCGLADVHFRWNETCVRTLRRHFTWLILIVVPAVVLIAAAERRDAAWQDSVGRIAFLVAMGAVAVFIMRGLHPTAGALAHKLDPKSGWAYEFRHVWYGAACAVPIALGIVSAIGYQYTALLVAGRLVQTACVIVGFLLIHEMMLRAVVIMRQRMVIRQAKEKRIADAQGKSVEEVASADTPDPEALLEHVTAQTGRLARAVVGLGLILGLWFTWADMLPALRFLQDFELWTYTTQVAVNVAPNGGAEPAAAVTRSVEAKVTLVDLSLALLIAGLTIALARNIRGLLEISILQRLRLDPGARYAITAIACYLVIIVGMVVSFGAIGVRWSQVQWLAAAVTVGLGFGLQEIFANFVCGLIILLERPIRVGDIVTVGEVEGKVTRIRIRATTIVDWDRREMIIPNKDFITGRLINWTLSDPVTRLIVPVGIAYGSDTARARNLLLNVARTSPYVLSDPAPTAIFRRFGDSSLDFELRVFLATRETWPQLTDDLHSRIDDAFREASIEIAFPQRDLHIRSARAPVSVRSLHDGIAPGPARAESERPRGRDTADDFDPAVSHADH